MRLLDAQEYFRLPHGRTRRSAAKLDRRIQEPAYDRSTQIGGIPFELFRIPA